jgi:hypothetical protein
MQWIDNKIKKWICSFYIFNEFLMFILMFYNNSYISTPNIKYDWLHVLTSFLPVPGFVELLHLIPDGWEVRPFQRILHIKLPVY